MKDKNWLKEQRIKYNLTQADLAEKINLSKATIENIEQGKRMGDEATWNKIETFFRNNRNTNNTINSKFLKAIKNQDYYENFITRSIKCSNAIEGNTLSYSETYSIVFNYNSLPLTNVKPRELYEAINLKYALSYSLDNLNKFDNGLIINIGNTINKNIKDTVGYRKIVNYIKGADFVPPKPEMVPSQMSELIYQYNNSSLDSVEKIASFHIQFEHIHPFEDGNGRTGRVLINHQLLMNNEIPIVIPEERRTEYFDYLQNYDVDGFTKMIKELQQEELKKMKEYEKKED